VFLCVSVPNESGLRPLTETTFEVRACSGDGVLWAESTLDSQKICFFLCKIFAEYLKLLQVVIPSTDKELLYN